MTCSQRVSRSSQSVTYGSTARSAATGPPRSQPAPGRRCRALLRACARSARAGWRRSRSSDGGSRRRRSESRTVPRTRRSIVRAPRASPDRRPHPARRPKAGTGSSHRSPDAHSAPRASPRASTRRSPRAQMRAVRDARRASRRAVSVPRRARPTVRPSAAAVGRAPVGRDEQWDVVVAVLELDLHTDSLEERRWRTEEEAIDAGLEIRRELWDPAFGIGLGGGDEVLAPQLDAHAASRLAALGVENVGGERDGHDANLSAWTRCSFAISRSSARTRWPSRTISLPPT